MQPGPTLSAQADGLPPYALFDPPLIFLGGAAGGHRWSASYPHPSMLNSAKTVMTSYVHVFAQMSSDDFAGRGRLTAKLLLLHLIPYVLERDQA